MARARDKSDNSSPCDIITAGGVQLIPLPLRHETSMHEPPSVPKRYRVVVTDDTGRREVVQRDTTLIEAMRIKLSFAPRYPKVTIEEQSEGENSF